MNELIYKQEAIETMCLACGHDCDKSKFVYNAPHDEQVIMCPEHYALSTLPSASTDLSTFLDKLWKIAYERGKEEGRKKGKWIDKSDGIEGAWNYCSVCMEQAIDLYDFCPNCGADMRDSFTIPTEIIESVIGYDD